MSEENNPYSQCRDLHTSSSTHDKGEVKAVNGVTFNLEKGKDPRYCRRIRFRQIRNRIFHYAVFWKRTARSLHRRQNPLQRTGYCQNCSEKQMREFRGEKCCSIIFQDPMTSLNPVLYRWKPD